LDGYASARLCVLAAQRALVGFTQRWGNLAIEVNAPPYELSTLADSPRVLVDPEYIATTVLLVLALRAALS